MRTHTSARIITAFLTVACIAFLSHTEVISVRALNNSSIREAMHKKIKTLINNQSFWMLPLRNRKLGTDSFGDKARMRVALNKLLTGQSFMLSVMGGSVTEGGGFLLVICLSSSQQSNTDLPTVLAGGTERNPAWPMKLVQLLQNLFPLSNISLNNGARGATGSDYMQLCINQHVKKEADLIMIEYAVNEPWQGVPLNTLDKPLRRNYETLIRKALDYPKKPSVVQMSYYSWYQPQDKPAGFEDYSKRWVTGDNISFYLSNGTFWGNAERDYSEIARYYHLPALSVKAACYELFLANAMHFQVMNGPVDMYRHLNETPDTDEVSQFYNDRFHPYSSTGHRVVAEIAFHSFLVLMLELLEAPLTEVDEIEANLPLLPPMFKGNIHASKDQCWFRENFKTIVVESLGWTFMNEATHESC